MGESHVVPFIRGTLAGDWLRAETTLIHFCLVFFAAIIWRGKSEISR